LTTPRGVIGSNAISSTAAHCERYGYSISLHIQ
jgi:hypothetical protein